MVQSLGGWGGLEKQRSMDSDGYAFFDSKIDVFLRGLAYGSRPFGGGGLEGQRPADLDRYVFFEAEINRNRRTLYMGSKAYGFRKA